MGFKSLGYDPDENDGERALADREAEMWNAIGGGRPEPKAEPVVKKTIQNSVRRLKIPDTLAEAQAPIVTQFELENPEVVSWLRAYTGTFEFYLSLRDYFDRNGFLSEKQTEAVKRAIARDGGVTKPVSRPVVVAVKREYSLKVGTLLRLNKTFANRLGREAGLVRAHYLFEVLDVKHETNGAYLVRVRTSAQRTNFCAICGSSLSNPESVEKGIGPVCGSGYELDWNSDRDLLLQLSEKLSKTVEVETWIPKFAIKERIEK